MENLAAEAGCVRKEKERWKEPSYDEFCAALKVVHGAAGLDGWSTIELDALVRFAPWLMEELRDLLVRTTR